MNAERLSRHGFVLVPQALAPAEIDELLIAVNAAIADPRSAILTRGGQPFGMRDLFRTMPAVRELAASDKILGLVRAALGDSCHAVRSLFFDKPASANWKVPWHQDLTIVVKERRDAEGYAPWSVKAGILHVQPPTKILESMIAVRVHLDDCPESNGALRVIPGSHRASRLSADQIAHWAENQPAETIEAKRGDILIMRPLLLHASSPSEHPAHRRIIHLEYANAELAGGLEWQDRLEKEFS